MPAPEVPAAPPAAAAVFGTRLDRAVAFAGLLADTGVSHGLIGPREIPILWDRHLLNCAVVERAFPEGAVVVDVGSGAGLPGLALAIARPDLQMHLVEPMLRRTAWLTQTVAALGLDSCSVHRGRAEDFHGTLLVPFATARAVARIDRLARWTFPLLERDGTLVALKGSQAAEELAAEELSLRRLGMVSAQIRSYGDGLLETPTVTMELTARPGDGQRRPRTGRKAPKSRRSR